MKKNKIIFFCLIIVVTYLSSETVADELTLTPFIGFKLEYDDNITFEERERNEVEDLIYITTPGLDLYRKSERLFADIQTKLDIEEYKNEEDFDTVDQEYIGTIDYKLTERLTLNLKGSYHRDSDPERDIPERAFGETVEESDDTGLLTQTKNDRTRKRLILGSTYYWDEITSTNISYGFIKRNFKEKGPGDEIDSKSNLFNITFVRELSPERLTAEFLTGYHHYNPESKTDRIVEVADINTFYFSLGGKYYFREVSFVRAHIGLRHTETTFKVPDRSRLFFREPEDNDVGVIGDVTFENEFTETLHGDISFRHDLRPSSGRGGEVRRTSIDGNIIYQITYELEARLRGGVYFTDADQGDFSTTDLDRDFVRISPILNYDFTRNLIGTISYTYSHEREEEDEGIGEATVSRINTSARHVIYFGIKWLFPYEM
jgi:hypothetical protein